MDHCEKRGQIFKVAMKLLYFVFLFLYLYFLYLYLYCEGIRMVHWSTVKSADKSSRRPPSPSCFILYLCFNICLCSFCTCICICIVRTLEWTTVKSVDKSSRWPRSCFILRHCPLIFLSQFLSADGFYRNQF